MGATLDRLVQAKARIRTKAKHPFRVIERRFGCVKVKHRGLAKNKASLVTQFAPSNLWMGRRRFWQRLQGWVRLHPAKGPAARGNCTCLRPQQRRFRHQVAYLASMVAGEPVLKNFLTLMQLPSHLIDTETAG